MWKCFTENFHLTPKFASLLSHFLHDNNLCTVKLTSLIQQNNNFKYAQFVNKVQGMLQLINKT